MNRRLFLTSAIGFLAAPAIVRATSIMPVKALPTAASLIGALDYRGGAYYAVAGRYWYVGADGRIIESGGFDRDALTGRLRDYIDASLAA